MSESKESKTISKILNRIIIGFFVVYALLIVIALYMPRKVRVHVNEVGWQSRVDIEDYVTEVKEDNYAPLRANIIGEYNELVGYEPVVERVQEVEKTVKVNKGVQTVKKDVEQSDGSIKEVTYTVPIYENVCYVKEEPIFTNKPIYAKKYVFEQSDWKTVRSIEASGEGTDSFYGDVTLSETEREKNRNIDYLITGQVTYKEYLLGDYITRNKTYVVSKKDAENIKPGQDIEVWLWVNNKVLYWSLI